LKIAHTELDRYLKQCIKKGDKLVGMVMPENEFDNLRNLIYQLEAFAEGFSLSQGKESTILSGIVCDLNTYIQSSSIRYVEPVENL